MHERQVGARANRTWLWILAILVAIAAVYMVSQDSAQPDDRTQPGVGTSR